MRRGYLAAAVGLGAIFLASSAGGCGSTEATVRYANGLPDETVKYDTVTYQFVKDRKIQVVLVRRLPAPRMATDTDDFEYVYFELPDKDRYGWLKEDKTPVYRWVHEGSRDSVWLATAGDVTEAGYGAKQDLRLDFRMTMEPLVGDGRSHIFSGSIAMTENVTITQGLINRYGLKLMALLGQKPKEPPPAPPKAPKAPADPKAKPKKGLFG